MHESHSSARSGRRSKLSYINPFTSGAGLMGRLGRGFLLILVLYLIATPFICIHAYMRSFTPFFDPGEPYRKEGVAKPVPGVVFSDALITLGEQLMVAWLPNDQIYPTVFLDNPQNFQLGQLEVIRYSTRVLRDKLSRQRTTDKIDPHADRAFTDFSNNPHFWLFPSAESKYASGISALKDYREGVIKGQSKFYPRADNLIELLDQLTSLLGGENTRLSNAPRIGSNA